MEDKNEHVQNGEQYPLEIKSTMDRAEERMTRKVMSSFSQWNYPVFQWAVGIINDFTNQNQQVRKSDEAKLVPTEAELAKELGALIVVDDFIIDNTSLLSPMQNAVGYSFNTLATEVGSRSMTNAILGAMHLSFDIQYDMSVYNRILDIRKEWLASELYDTTMQKVPAIISSGIENGATIDEMTSSIQDVLGMDKDRAAKIARTETNYAANEAIRRQTHTLGITKYRISTAVDACELCVMAAQKEYTFKEAQNLLPLHPNDRCVLQSVIPKTWLGIEKSIKEQRIEKTLEKGYIPIKGIDYYTDDEIEEVKKAVTPVRGKDYLTKEELAKVKKEIAPKKGVDFLVKEEVETIRKEITPIKNRDYRDGIDGYTPKKGKDYFDGKNGKPGRNGKDGNKIKPEEIVGKLESIEDDEKKLSTSAIKNFDKEVRKRIPKVEIRGGGGGGKDWKVKVDGTDTENFLEDKIEAGSNVTISKANGKLRIASTGGSGTNSHSDLTQLDYASSGHTGFQPAGSYLTTETDPVYTADKSSIALKSEIPTDVSELTDTTGVIPTDTNDLTNGAGFITAGDIPAIPEDVSDLTDNTGLLGNATKIQGFDITTTDPTDGKILVYRTSSSAYVLEDKPASGANPSAADVSFTPGGDIVAINVQDAIIEVDSEKASKNFVIAMAAAL